MEPTPPVQVHALGDLVHYQDGAIVSHTLLKKPAGTLTLFAFDAGEGLSEHTAPFEAFVYLVDGEATITVAGQAYRLRSGETITLPANIPHAVHALQRCKMLLTMIRS